AHAVAAKQRNDLAGPHFEVDTEKNLASTIRALEALDAEHQSFLAKIRRPHAGVALDLVGRTDCDSATACEHGYAVREAKYGIHIMLDEKNRDLPLEPPEKTDHFRCLRRAKAGERLVEHQ